MPAHWINKSISILETDKSYIAARPIDDDLDALWLNKYEQIDDFYVAYTFTDRMFLTNVNSLSSADFNINTLNFYPLYGKSGFESKVFNYMNKSQLKKLIAKDSKYIHEYSEYIEFISKDRN